MLLFLGLSDRPGFAGKTTMLTYIQINAAKPSGLLVPRDLSECRIRVFLHSEEEAERSASGQTAKMC
jgi:hypothetical protein